MGGGREGVYPPSNMTNGGSERSEWGRSPPNRLLNYISIEVIHNTNRCQVCIYYHNHKAGDLSSTGTSDTD